VGLHLEVYEVERLAAVSTGSVVGGMGDDSWLDSERATVEEWFGGAFPSDGQRKPVSGDGVWLLGGEEISTVAVGAVV
jgi:hypothetical protein